MIQMTMLMNGENLAKRYHLNVFSDKMAQSMLQIFVLSAESFNFVLCEPSAVSQRLQKNSAISKGSMCYVSLNIGNLITDSH